MALCSGHGQGLEDTGRGSRLVPAHGVKTIVPGTVSAVSTTRSFLLYTFCSGWPVHDFLVKTTIYASCTEMKTTPVLPISAAENGPLGRNSGPFSVHSSAR